MELPAWRANPLLPEAVSATAADSRTPAHLDLRDRLELLEFPEIPVSQDNPDRLDRLELGAKVTEHPGLASRARLDLRDLRVPLAPQEILARMDNRDSPETLDDQVNPETKERPVMLDQMETPESQDNQANLELPDREPPPVLPVRRDPTVLQARPDSLDNLDHHRLQVPQALRDLKALLVSQDNPDNLDCPDNQASMESRDRTLRTVRAHPEPERFTSRSKQSPTASVPSKPSMLKPPAAGCNGLNSLRKQNFQEKLLIFIRGNVHEFTRHLCLMALIIFHVQKRES